VATDVDSYNRRVKHFNNAILAILFLGGIGAIANAVDDLILLWGQGFVYRGPGPTDSPSVWSRWVAAIFPLVACAYSIGMASGVFRYDRNSSAFWFIPAGAFVSFSALSLYPQWW
jgi:hypothetical protein